MNRRALPTTLAALIMISIMTPGPADAVPTGVALPPTIPFALIGSKLVLLNENCGSVIEIGSVGTSNVGALAFVPGELPLHGTLYAVADRSTAPKLLAIDPTTASAVVRGAITPTATNWVTAEALAYNPADGFLYAAGSADSYYSRNIARIDLSTGAATVVSTMSGTMPHNGDADAMAFAAGALYVSDSDGVVSNIHRVDIETGVPTLLSTLPYVLTDLAYDPWNHRLMGVDYKLNKLVDISPDTGAVRSTWDFARPSNSDGYAMGLAFGSATSAPQLAQAISAKLHCI